MIKYVIMMSVKTAESGIKIGITKEKGFGNRFPKPKSLCLNAYCSVRSTPEKVLHFFKLCCKSENCVAI